MLLQESSAEETRKKPVKTVRRRRDGRRVGQIGRFIAVIVVVFLSLAPLYWTFITSVKNGVELFASPPTFFPHSFDLSNYVQVFNSEFFLPTLRNSALIAIITTLLSLLIGMLC